MRAGRFLRHPLGYRAFHPAPLPPDPPVAFDAAMLRLLSESDRAVGRLDGVAATLPNPALFLAMYVRREAVLSSQIEGTQASLVDVLTYESGDPDASAPGDVGEVVNYVHAMNRGMNGLEELPLSLRLIREIHAELMRGVRGSALDPGEFRRTQNWIGPAGCSLADAAFVPPPPEDVPAALGALEKFLHDDSLPPLVHAALVHAQFETIHPFLDGNGRMGRLLIAFQLCARGVLSRPLLYLSGFLKRHRAEYYDRLQAVRDSGAWEPWITFFLRGVAETAADAHGTAGRIVALRDDHRAQVQSVGRAGANLLRLHDVLFEQPIVSARWVSRRLSVGFPAASAMLDRMRSLGIVDETTGGRRNRRFAYRAYLRLFEGADARTD
ncbi:MAG: hypothetical protein HMLKMBBP_01265 [Planctomycetes bacterium]|nr:hypothetical protein [Planctomycetota bacterium]